MTFNALLIAVIGVAIVVQYALIVRLEKAEDQIRKQWRRLDNDE